MNTTKVKEEDIKGEVYQSLNRSSAQIRSDRGDNIAEDLEMTFKRGIEDIELDIKRLKRERTNMYDFSPSTSTSLVMAADVSASNILKKDNEISLTLREYEIKLAISVERYNTLFGKDYKSNLI